VRLWLPGAVQELRRLHACPDEPRQLAPKPKRVR
jgi:hypothetical protein